MKPDTLLGLALNLTASLQSKDRYTILLNHVLTLIPCDAACLLEKRGTDYHVLAHKGLVDTARDHVFHIAEHPRLAIIEQSTQPTLFPHDSPLPDPFDGMIANHETEHLNVHSCLGCPLYVNDTIVGMLTADANKPFQFDHLDLNMLALVGAMAGATLQTSKLIEETERKVQASLELSRTLMKEANEKYQAPLLGISNELETIRRHIDIVAASDLPVMIQGETGVGKEVVARHIHQKSLRANKSLIYVNCAALPETIAESELFGHVRGAFTGADKDRMGKFQLAHEGTLFLDEIGELPITIQPKLLRAIQEGEIQRVGSDKTVKVNVRVISATNRNVLEEIEKSRFRADLYHRLSAYPMYITSLKQRRDDIPILANYFLDVFHKRFNTKPIRISDSAMTVLRHYDWPGNVRELKNTLSRAILKAHHERGKENQNKTLQIESDDVSAYLPNTDTHHSRMQPLTQITTSIQPLREATTQFQKNAILSAYKAANHNWSKAAKLLGMNRSNLYHLAKKLDLIS